MPLKRIMLEGGAVERGRAHGEALGDMIDAGLRRWREVLAEQTGIPPEQTIGPLVSGTGFETTIRRWAPEELIELEALADAAEQPRNLLLAYNLMDEEWWFSRERGRGTGPHTRSEQSAPGCTGLAIRAGANGAPITGQNMDLGTFYGPGRVLFDVRPDDGPQQLIVSFAGFLGTMGVSRVPLSVNVNTLMSLHHSTSGLPVTFIIRRLLAQPSLSAAIAFLLQVPHASGQNFLIGSAEGVVDFEASASGLSEWAADEPAFAHTNHPLVNQNENAKYASPNASTLGRMELAAAAVTGASTLDDLEHVLADRTVPVCIVGSAPAETDTFAAMAVEHTSPPRVRIAPGPPSETPFTDIAWKA